MGWKPFEPNKDQEQCPNGHPANSDGNCSEPNCTYHVKNKHTDSGR